MKSSSRAHNVDLFNINRTSVNTDICIYVIQFILKLHIGSTTRNPQHATTKIYMIQKSMYTYPSIQVCYVQRHAYIWLLMDWLLRYQCHGHFRACFQGCSSCYTLSSVSHDDCRSPSPLPSSLLLLVHGLSAPCEKTRHKR